VKNEGITTEKGGYQALTVNKKQCQCIFAAEDCSCEGCKFTTAGEGAMDAK
jgi:hypothetical protein